MLGRLQMEKNDLEENRKLLEAKLESSEKYLSSVEEQVRGKESEIEELESKS